MPGPTIRTRRSRRSRCRWRPLEPTGAISRHRQAEDVCRSCDPAAGRRHHLVQRTQHRGVLPARSAPHHRARAAEDRRRRRHVRHPRARPRRRPVGAGRRRSSRDRARARRSRPGAARAAQARRLSDARRTAGRAQEGRSAQGAQGTAVLEALSVHALGSPVVARRYFGTDGVRGIVGADLTPELVERLGRASAYWSGGGRIFIGRDTRASGVELEDALARGIADAGGNAVIAGVLPTPAVALLTLDLGCVITASHNPPEYNGVKFFDRDGQKLSDASEEEIEALLDRPGIGGGGVDRVVVAPDSSLEPVIEGFGSDLSRLHIVVDCANGAYSGLAPKAFEQLGARTTTIGDAPDGTNINVGRGATD